MEETASGLKGLSYRRSARPKTSCIASAISSTCVSKAKCPVSNNLTVAFGLSFRYASAPAGIKNTSFFPQLPARAA